MKQRRLSLRMSSRAGVAAGLLLLSGMAASAAPKDPSGTWLTEDGRGRIRVERCGPKLEQVCGYVVWMKEPNDAKNLPLKDTSNPDPAKRSRALLGHQLILNLKPNDDDRFEGQIYDAENGKKYDITLWKKGSDTLKIKGCMLSLLCGSQSWTPTTDVLPGQLTAPTGGPNGPRPD